MKLYIKYPLILTVLIIFVGCSNQNNLQTPKKVVIKKETTINERIENIFNDLENFKNRKLEASFEKEKKEEIKDYGYMNKIIERIRNDK